jgi:serine/threonine protein phosphatase 1
MAAMPHEQAADLLAGDTALVPDDTLVYAVGDIHGRADLLEKMHEAILRDAAEAPCSRKVVIYLGDYVDRGPDSKRVVDVLLERPLAGFERYHLMGNHEAFLLEFLIDIEAGPGWFFNGGLQTLGSYGVNFGKHDDMSFDSLVRIQDDFLRRVPERHLDFFRRLDFSRTEGDYFFVHAGVRPGIPLENQSDEDMLWIRDEFLSCDEEFGKIVVHGHTITWEPDIRSNRIGIDTGAFASGVLTALVLEGRERDFLRVSGEG